jgi:hypothetical protein
MAQGVNKYDRVCSSFGVEIKDVTNGVSSTDDYPEYIIEIRNEETHF